MLTFHLAWCAVGGLPTPQLRAEGQPLPAQPAALIAPTSLTVLLVPEAGAVLTLAVDPAAFVLTATASAGILHYFRLADGTVKPLPNEPAPLTFQAGDAYIAVTTASLAAAPPGDLSTALARFLHLRDYFNADKLAAALLAHLAELTDSNSDGASVLVIELR